MRVLVAEDDAGLRSVVARGLRESGYVVDAVPDGQVASDHLLAYDYEVAVIDWRMPGQDGLALIEGLRRRHDSTPVLMLTARDSAADRVIGLDGGADDYLVKPFHFSELLARLRALQRRAPHVVGPVLECGDLRFDPATRKVTVDGEEVPLTARETALAELFLRRNRAVTTLRDIALQLWPQETDAVGSNTIQVHILRLRKKLVRSQVCIETIRGVGYRLVDR